MSPPVATRQAPRSRVVQHVKQAILQGELLPGQALPSKLALARQIGVNPRTVTNGLHRLSEEGVLCHNGGRLRVVASLIQNGSDARAVPAAGDREAVSEELRATTSPMRNVVAVLTLNTQVEQDERSQLGFTRFIGYGAVEAIQEAGLHVLTLHPDRVLQGDDRHREIDHLIAGRPFGVVISDIKTDRSLTRSQDLAAEFIAKGIPAVVYGNHPDASGFDRVSADHENGAYQLTRWLIGQGRRRILPLWISPASHYWFVERRRGYDRAMQEAGLEPLPILDIPRFTPENGKDPSGNEFAGRVFAGYLLEWLSGEAVDALLLSDDNSIPPAARACEILGRLPGRDMLLAGYDNLWSEVEGAVAPSVTIDKRNLDTGKELVRLLLDRVEGRLPNEPQLRLIEPKLVLVAGN